MANLQATAERNIWDDIFKFHSWVYVKRTLNLLLSVSSVEVKERPGNEGDVMFLLSCSWLWIVFGEKTL